MSDTSHAAMRVQLTAELERVSGQLKELGIDRASYDEGFADSGQVTAERGEIEALAGTLRETLDEIEVALDKLDQGTYGRCENCGGEISEARLEAKPAARLCINCASARR